jgi:hypothetical protein
MKPYIFMGLFLFFSSLESADTISDRFGLGIIVGEPTGVSVKNWLTRRNAIDGALAWSFSGHTSVQLHADYLFHDYNLLRQEDLEGELPFYYGIGGLININGKNGFDNKEDETRLGIRFPLGINYLFEKNPFDIFIEIVPVLDIVPETDFILNGAVGARFYF